MTWRQINGYQYPYRINEEAQVQKWDGKQWIDIRARISGNRAVVYLRTVEGKQYKAALVRLMDDAFWEGRAKRDGLHITHRNGVKLDCELRNLVAVKPGQAGRKYHGRPHKDVYKRQQLSFLVSHPRHLGRGFYFPQNPNNPFLLFSLLSSSSLICSVCWMICRSSSSDSFPLRDLAYIRNARASEQNEASSRDLMR